MKTSEKNEIRDKIEALPPAERLEIISNFCNHCGYKLDREGWCTCHHNEDGEDEGEPA